MARLTNAYSKKKRNLDAAVAMHVFWYNFGRYHSSLKCTPAMAAGLCGHAWTYEEMIAEALAEADKLAAAPPLPPVPVMPPQLELPFYINAGGPTGPQLDLFG